jgi:hypothetical protein
VGPQSRDTEPPILVWKIAEAEAALDSKQDVLDRSGTATALIDGAKERTPEPVIFAGRPEVLKYLSWA